MNFLFTENITIPKRRIGAVIGKEGASKKKLEKELNCKINVDKEGAVAISSAESFNVYVGSQIIKAIGRGFSIETALMLKDDNFGFDSIDIEEWAHSRKDIVRLKSRIIGREGEAKKRIMAATECELVISGDTVSIIGGLEGMAIARQAIEKLLNGAEHATVFKFLDDRVREIKKKLIF